MQRYITQGYGPFVSEFAQGAGQLVGAAGASAVAVYSFQTGNGILNLHASYKWAYALEVAVAAAGESDAADDIGLSLYVNEFWADKVAGLKDGAANAVLGCIGY